MIKRKHSRLLVESILNGNTEKADKILAKIIAEAEEDREDQARAQANAELGIDDQEEQGAPKAEDDFDAEGDEFDAQDGGEEQSLGDELDDVTAPEDSVEEFASTPQETVESDTELTNLVDQQSNFEAQVNNLVLNDLLNQVADLKTALENNTTLDKHSREFYEIKVPLQYYGETLLKIQKNITPLVNQDEVKKQLDEIGSSLSELSDKIGGGDSTTIDTPDQVMEKEMGSQF